MRRALQSHELSARKTAAGVDVTHLSVQGFFTSQPSLVPTCGTPHLFTPDPFILSCQ